MISPDPTAKRAASVVLVDRSHIEHVPCRASNFDSGNRSSVNLTVMISIVVTDSLFCGLYFFTTIFDDISLIIIDISYLFKLRSSAELKSVGVILTS